MIASVDLSRIRQRMFACILFVLVGSGIGCSSMNRQSPENADEEAMSADVRAALATATPGSTFSYEIDVDESGVVTVSGVRASDIPAIRSAIASVGGVRQVRFINVIDDVIAAFPRFPWPPPDASATYEIPSQLIAGQIANPTLGTVAERIRIALTNAGYPGAKFFAVPQGFAVLTKLEQTDANGRPKRGSARFSLEVAADDQFSLSEYLNALLHGRRGYYRVIAIIVTASPLPTSPATPTSTELERLTRSGTLLLPEAVAETNLTSGYHTWALIYEFAKADYQEAGTLIRPARVTPLDHMRYSRILPALERLHAAR